ncbi:MAG: DUF2815 family protein [Youngiibacter sp.]|nr:DUF2815 family protein [Youngiibacter sp.]
MANVNPTLVITGKARLTFPHLFTPYAKELGQEAKYSVTILVPKSDVLTRQKIDAAIMAATQAGIAKSWNGVKPPILATPVHDGDGVRPSDGQPFAPECKGHWVFTASSKQQPQVVDTGLNPIMAQSEIYSGVYARVSVNFFPYNASGKKGIGCGLNNVQKLEDGEPLGGRTTALSDFGDATGFQAAPAPQYGQQPSYGQQAPQQYAPAPQQYQTPPASQYGQPYQAPQYQQAPVYGQPAPQIDPITGMPIVPPMGY